MDENRKTEMICNSIENKIKELKAKNPKIKLSNSVGWILMLTYK